MPISRRPTARRCSAQQLRRSLAGLPKSALFDQVFGLVRQHQRIERRRRDRQAINLTRETVANILLGSYTDWSKSPRRPRPSLDVPATIKLSIASGSGTRHRRIDLLPRLWLRQVLSINDQHLGPMASPRLTFSPRGATPGAITYGRLTMPARRNCRRVAVRRRADELGSDQRPVRLVVRGAVDQGRS